MSNCVVGSVGLRLPGSIIAEHSVEGSDHFSHDGDDDDLGFLVGVGKTVGEGLESGIVSACAEDCHVEDVTDRHPTTVDTSVSPELATVEVVWCETDESGDLLAAHLPEFWQQGDEREGQHRADAWHRSEQLIGLNEKQHWRPGGLMAYGVDVMELFRRSASYVDRILKGERPSDLPVQQMAKAFGLDVPPGLLVAADEVIE
jgi:hypothetical protein